MLSPDYANNFWSTAKQKIFYLRRINQNFLARVSKRGKLAQKGFQVARGEYFK